MNSCFKETLSKNKQIDRNVLSKKTWPFKWQDVNLYWRARIAAKTFNGNADLGYAILGDPGAVSRVGRKGGSKVFKYGRKSPWVPILTELFPMKFKQMPAPDRAQKMLCIIVPNRPTVSSEFFSWIRTRPLLSRLRLVWIMLQRNAHSQETFNLI